MLPVLLAAHWGEAAGFQPADGLKGRRSTSPQFDVRIINGDVIDGTGRTRFRADVVVFDPKTIRDVSTYEDPTTSRSGSAT